uniref:Uncharacterized protein n=1 Tax=Anopheles maculatus TaxID=74869 RepID=A0A182S9I4_9DIPT
MSLKTVTIALDNKLRSLRDSSIDSDRDQTQESDGDLSGGGGTGGGYGTGRHSLHQQWSHMGRSPRPLTLGENIPYADESPERPLIQGRSKPQRTLTIAGNNNNHEDSNGPATITPAKQQLKKALTAHSQKSIDSGGTVNSSTNNSCLTLVNEADATLDGGILIGGGDVEGGGGVEVAHELDENGQQQPSVGKGRNVSLSSDETDTSTTSNPREKLTAATYRIDTEKLKKMNRILTQLERKANNLERKFNLNRSLSLNYKSPKAVDCCCSHHALPVTHSAQQQSHCCQHQQQQQQHISNSLNNNNSTSCHNHNGSVGGSTIGNTIVSLRSRFSLTKDEKTDKNINRRRQIHDTSATSHAGSCVTTGNGNATGSNDSSSCSGEPGGPQIILTPAVPPAASATTRQRRHAGSRSIRRRHTVGGTHDYYSNKMNGQHHHHHHHAHHHPHNHHHAGPGCCPVPQN